MNAELGCGLVKKRVALPGRGKRGGARTLVATNKKERWIFLFGFSKNEKANITVKELEAMQELSLDLLNLSDSDLDYAVSRHKLMEIYYGEQE